MALLSDEVDSFRDGKSGRKNRNATRNVAGRTQLTMATFADLAKNVLWQRNGRESCWKGNEQMTMLEFEAKAKKLATIDNKNLNKILVNIWKIIIKNI